MNQVIAHACQLDKANLLALCWKMKTWGRKHSNSHSLAPPLKSALKSQNLTPTTQGKENEWNLRTCKTLKVLENETELEGKVENLRNKS